MIRVHEQGSLTYVIGTDDAHEACRALGISPETHRWSSTIFGKFVRRQREWRSASELMPPKDAVSGVCFVGPIREKP